MRVGQEYNPYASLSGVERISVSILLGVTGLKTKDLAFFCFDKSNWKNAFVPEEFWLLNWGQWSKRKERKGTLFKCLVVLPLEHYLGTL